MGGNWCMWRSLKNFFHSLRTYSDLSPDLRMRQRVNRMLSDRPQLNPEDWHQKFWQSLNITQQVSNFVYQTSQIIQDSTAAEFIRAIASRKIYTSRWFAGLIGKNHCDKTFSPNLRLI